MTEISYLINLLLNHKLPKVTRENIRARIQLLETTLSYPAPREPRPHPSAPSTAAPSLPMTPAAAQALADRQAALAGAGNTVFKKHS
jgi:hypothetical protein